MQTDSGKSADSPAKTQTFRDGSLKHYMFCMRFLTSSYWLKSKCRAEEKEKAVQMHTDVYSN